MKIFLILCCFLAPNINSQKISYRNFPDEVIKASSPEYYANLILKKVSANTTRLSFDVSEKCLGQLLTYALSLLSFEDWAVNMFDASTKLPSGLLRGYGSALGSFDQCLNVQRESNASETIRGKYCLGALPIVDLTPRTAKNKNRMINLEDYKISLQWAMCLPDGCSAEDFEKLSILPLQVSTNSCQTAESQITKLDTEDASAIVVFSVILLLILLSTSYEAYNIYVKKVRTWDNLYSFSVISNSIKLTTVTNDDAEITCLHGLRVISLFFIMYGFRYATFMLVPIDNLLDMLEWIKAPLIAVYFEGILVVDTFFLISGMLICYNYLKKQEQGFKFNVLSYYLSRIIRLSPALIAIVLLNGTLMRHIGSGPVWPLMKNTLLVNNCRNNWWSTILYVQNYINPNDTCLIQTWHLAVDMQLYLISPFVLLFLNFGRVALFVSCGILILGAAVANFVIGWKFEIKSLFLASLIPEEFTKYMSLVFYGIQTRIPPWIIGFLLGYLLYITRQKSVQEKIHKFFTPIIVVLCWILASGLIVLCFASPGIVGADYDWVKNSLHVALIRIPWSLGVAWVIFACVHGFSGPVNYILSAPIFQRISRISYCIFLTNTTVIILLSLQTRRGEEFSNINVFNKFWTDLAYTITVGFIWTLAFESPMIRMQKAFFPMLLKLTDPMIAFQETVIERIKEKRHPKIISTSL